MPSAAFKRRNSLCKRVTRARALACCNEPMGNVLTDLRPLPALARDRRVAVGAIQSRARGCDWLVGKGTAIARGARRQSGGRAHGKVGVPVTKETRRAQALPHQGPALGQVGGGIGGSGEIRTHGWVTPSAVFKTAALNHSATLPWTLLRSACKVAIVTAPGATWHRVAVSFRRRTGTAPAGRSGIAGQARWGGWPRGRA